MTELAQASRALLDKVFGLLEVFDLSFFVSGAALMAALFYAEVLPGYTLLLGMEDHRLHDVPALGWSVLVVASYVAGLACFSLGRSLGRRIAAWNPAHREERGVFELLSHHALIRRGEAGWEPTDAGARMTWLPRYVQAANEPGFHAGGGVQSALYVRMWAELRGHRQLSNSFGLLRRYWVSAATLDGLFVAGLAWAAVLWQAGYGWGAAASGAGALLSSFEARRYDQHQKRELVATMAQLYDERESVRRIPKRGETIATRPQ